MKPVSFAGKSNSRKEWEDYAWERLLKDFAKISSPRDIENILAKIVTAHEKKQIAKRLAAVELLKQGKSYKEISRILWLSPTTISALKKSINGGDYVSGYELYKKRGRKIWSSFPNPARKGAILPHGKLVFPQRRNKYRS